MQKYQHLKDLQYNERRMPYRCDQEKVFDCFKKREDTSLSALYELFKEAKATLACSKLIDIMIGK